MQNFVYEWVDFSIFSEDWAKIGLNLRKFEKQKTINKKKRGEGNFVKILTKLGSVSIWMGHFFLESWYMYGSCFKFPAACPYQNQTWVTSPQMMAALLSVVIWMRCQISQDPTSVQNVVSPKCRFPTSGGLLIWKIKRYIKESTLSVQIWKTCCHGQSKNIHIVSPNLNNRLSVKKRRRKKNVPIKKACLQPNSD